MPVCGGECATVGGWVELTYQVMHIARRAHPRFAEGSRPVLLAVCRRRSRRGRLIWPPPTRSPVGSHAYYSSLAVTGLPLSSFRTETAKFIDDRWSGRGDETSYWPAAGVGEGAGVRDGVGDINPFAACSP